jgi:hypothetical protein
MHQLESNELCKQIHQIVPLKLSYLVIWIIYCRLINSFFILVRSGIGT